MTPAPSFEFRDAVYPWVVDCAALRTVGWRPAFSNKEALEVLLAEREGHHAMVGRRITRKDAVTAAGAAGAAAAALGTAAIVRQVRKKNKS